MKRFPKPLNPFRDKWDRQTADDLYRFLMSLWWAVAGSQGTPDTPSTVSAGVSADPGIAQAPSPSDHIHPISTAAPSIKVAFGGVPDEGSSASLTRSDAKHILEVGTIDEQTLMWKTDTWVPTPLEDYDVLTWMDL